MRKAARRPATRSGLDQRRQPITGRRVQERASQKQRDTRLVGTTVRFAGGLRFLVDGEVDPNCFQ